MRFDVVERRRLRRGGGLEPTGRRLRRRRARAAGGFTLIELLVAVAILGGAILFLVGSMATSVTLSDSARRTADVEVEARRFAEAVRDVDLLYVPCEGANNPVTAYAGAYTNSSRFTGAVVKVEIVTTRHPFQWEDCPPAGATRPPGDIDKGLQRVTVRVTSARTDPAVGRTVVVVKREF